MEQQDVYRELSKKLMMEHSGTLPLIWKILCTEQEANIVNALPASASELAAAFACSITEMQAILDELYHRGAVFEFVKDGTTYYRMPRHVVQFHDSSILWDKAPHEMLRLWEEFSEAEYPQLLELVTTIKLPSFMRVIPINEKIEAKNRVLAFEDAAAMLRNARVIAVTPCPCRKLMKRCDAPLETCIQLDRGADYAIKRGTGRKIDYEEALQVLKRSEEAGLVHATENTAGRSNAICNCCGCCCEMLRFFGDEKTRGVLAPSRFQARVDEDLCTSCGLCGEICPVDAIAPGDDSIATVRAGACIGCGLCASVCPTEAVSLIEVRAKEFVPGA